MLSRRRFLAGALAGLAGAGARGLRRGHPVGRAERHVQRDRRRARRRPLPQPRLPPISGRRCARTSAGCCSSASAGAPPPRPTRRCARSRRWPGWGRALLRRPADRRPAQRRVAGAAAALVRSLKEASTVAPLIVAIDQEGGRVARLDATYGFPPSRSAASSAGSTTGRDRAEARAMAEVLAAAGMTLNLAPVVDLAVNPTTRSSPRVDRSFGADPDVVIAQADRLHRGAPRDRRARAR